MFAKQPVAIVALAVVALQAVQEAVIEGLPLAAHLAISIVIIALGAVIARSKVAPVHLGREPIAAIGAVIAILQVVQQSIAGVSPGVRVAITVALVALGAIVAQNAVTPATQ